MDGMMKRIMAGLLALGLALWTPGAPWALAQVEITPDIREACSQFEPALRDIALTEVVPKLEEAAEPDASDRAKRELEVVETTALVIREATQTTLKAVEDPDAIAKSTAEALINNGVPADVAQKSVDQMKDALARAKETIQKGGTVEDVAKYLESCKSAMEKCSGFLGDRNLREIFATSGGGGAPSAERGEIYRSMDFLGRVIDPKQGGGDITGRCLEAHFETSFREAFLGGPTEGFGGPPSAEVMRGMMGQMMACGINPIDVLRGGGEFPGGPMGGPGEFHGPSPEALAAMTPEEKNRYETWKAGGFDPGIGAHHDWAGNVVTAEAMFRDMPTPDQLAKGSLHEGTSMDSRTETSGTSLTTFEDRYSDGHIKCPPGKTHVEGVLGGDPGHCIG